MSLRVLMVAALPACLVQEIDLRTPPDPMALEEVCTTNQRYVPGRGCVHCETLEHPLLTCPCAWAFQPADLPYCDTPEAYYECLPCSGDIESCNAYDPASGTSRDCYLLESCCTQLANDVDSTDCCEQPDELHCVVDTAAGYEGAQHLVGCLPPECCEGSACPGGQADCEAWQACVAGRCAPACHPTLEVCDVVAHEGDLVCVCNEAIAP